MKSSVTWTKVPTKGNKIASPRKQCRRRSTGDGGRTVAVLVGVSSSKRNHSLSKMVLGDVLKDDHLSYSAETKTGEASGETDFVPMLFCTLCGDETHTVRSCLLRNMGLLFLDS